jgi:hypothetical protein
MVDDEDYLLGGNQNVDVGTRTAFISGSAWWYEDFPNLDLSMMSEGFSWTDASE